MNKHATFQTGKAQGKTGCNDVIMSDLCRCKAAYAMDIIFVHFQITIPRPHMQWISPFPCFESAAAAVKVGLDHEKRENLITTIIEMCGYHIVPVKVPSRNPPNSEAKLHLLHNPLPATATATADTRNINNGNSASSLTDLRFLQEEDDDDGDDDEQDRENEWVDADSGSDTDQCSTPDQRPLLFPEDQLLRILQAVCSCRTQLEAKLLRDVREALRIAGPDSAHGEGYRLNSSHDLRRFVVNNLRCAGYHAGICRSRWEETNGYPAGDYEFIDVISVGARGKSDRVLVDIDFRAQFEIARPTAEYAALAEALPELVVGSADKMRDMIWIMSDAAKRSLKARGLHLPPWRKKRYLETKWLVSHNRIGTQLVPSQVLELNAWFNLQQRNQYRSGVAGNGRISGLGRALAVAVTHNNTNDVY